MDTSPTEQTAAERDEARRYGRRELACELAARVVDLAFLCIAAFILGGPDGWLMRHIPASGTPEIVRLAVLFLLLIVMNMAVSLPFSFYSGYVLEHQFGLSRLSLAGWIWRYTKRHLLEIAFGILLVPGLYWLIWHTGGWWWLVAAGAFFAVSVLLGQLAPVLIMPLFYKIARIDDPELATRMARLAAGTGLSIEGVYRMDLSRETVKANAMLAGLGRTRRVILGDTLLDNFTCAAGFWICNLLLSAEVRRHGPLDYAQFPIYTLPLLMLILSLLSTLLEPLQNAISRHYERQCDRYALTRTGLREAYRSAFHKLARMNKDDPEPNRAAVFLFHSHPPIAERIALADG
ncbi:MAG: M48 family metalloprotease [Planctomycetia bacterium]|nr:M48 family metalloprotease [Planctomycetia bacterium]